jgi:hypothetical protein
MAIGGLRRRGEPENWMNRQLTAAVDLRLGPTRANATLCGMVDIHRAGRT